LISPAAGRLNVEPAAEKLKKKGSAVFYGELGKKLT